MFVLSEAGDFIGSLDVGALHEEKPAEAEWRTAYDFARDPELFLLP